MKCRLALLAWAVCAPLGTLCAGSSVTQVALKAYCLSQAALPFSVRERLVPVIEDKKEEAVSFGRVALFAYDKLLSERSEHFQLRNEGDFSVTRVVVRLKYETLRGEPIDDREVVVEVNLPPGGARMVSVPSFDKTRSYRFHKSRIIGSREGIPFRVSAQILRFDVAVFPLE